MRDEAEVYLKGFGKPHPATIYPDEPIIFHRCSKAFRSLSEGSMQEIHAYCVLMEIKLRPLEVEIIIDLFKVARAIMGGEKPQEIMESYGWRN